jgi:DNA-binding CsgD family transcriptional regulator
MVTREPVPRLRGRTDSLKSPICRRFSLTGYLTATDTRHLDDSLGSVVLSLGERPVGEFEMMDHERLERFRVTPRQAAILDLVCQGKTDKSIAVALGVSKSTVRSHLGRFYKINQVQNRSEAATLWSLIRVSQERIHVLPG